MLHFSLICRKNLQISVLYSRTRFATEESAMEFLISAIIPAFLSGIPLEFESSNGRDSSFIDSVIGTWWKRWLAHLVIMTLVFSAMNYVLCPNLVGPWFGGIIVSETIVVCFIRMIARTLLTDDIANNRDVSMRYFYYFLTIISVMLIGPWVMNSKMLRSGFYSDLITKVEKKDWKSDMAPVDVAHIRLVSQAQAEWKAQQQMGQDGQSFGSKYSLGELHIQKVGQELMWVGVLDFRGFSSWSSYGTSPGFVMVSAEDPNRTPKLVTHHAFKYLTSSYFETDLERHLYTHGYQFKGTTDYTLEVDDDLKPSWVVTVFEPTIGFYGEVVTEVLLVNPESGEIVSYKPDKVPAWVDRVLPEEFAHTRLTNYGKFVHGWINSWWGEGDVIVPTVNDMKLVWTDDGHAKWFIGLTSPNSKDQALVGFALIDSRTGELREYNLSGANELAVDQIVAKEVANYSGYQATQPILYNVYGELTWAVPVIAGGIFQRVAFVHASNSTVAIGRNKIDALAAYRKLITVSGNKDVPSIQSATKTAQGKIRRISSAVANGETTFYLVLGEHSHVFTGTIALSHLLPVVNIGDVVRVKYLDTTEVTAPIISLEVNLAETDLPKQMTEVESK